MTELYRAMISSTTKDMVVHRQQALDAGIRQDFFPVMMEHLPPSPDDAVRRSLDLVDQVDVYVLILGLLTSPQHPFTETDIDLGATGPDGADYSDLDGTRGRRDRQAHR